MNIDNNINEYCKKSEKKEKEYLENLGLNIEEILKKNISDEEFLKICKKNKMSFEEADNALIHWSILKGIIDLKNEDVYTQEEIDELRI